MKTTDRLLAGDHCLFRVRSHPKPTFTSMTLSFSHPDVNSFFEPKIYICFGVIRNGLFHYVEKS